MDAGGIMPPQSVSASRDRSPASAATARLDGLLSSMKELEMALEADSDADTEPYAPSPDTEIASLRSGDAIDTVDAAPPAGMARSGSKRTSHLFPRQKPPSSLSSRHAPSSAMTLGNLQASASTLSGYLEKLNPARTFSGELAYKRRFFVFTPDSNLYLFKSNASPSAMPITFLPITQCESYFDAPEQSWIMQVHGTGILADSFPASDTASMATTTTVKRSWCLRFPDELTMTTWTQTIHRSIQMQHAASISSAARDNGGVAYFNSGASPFNNNLHVQPDSGSFRAQPSSLYSGVPRQGYQPPSPSTITRPVRRESEAATAMRHAGGSMASRVMSPTYAPSLMSASGAAPGVAGAPFGHMHYPPSFPPAVSSPPAFGSHGTANSRVASLHSSLSGGSIANVGGTPSNIMATPGSTHNYMSPPVHPILPKQQQAQPEYAHFTGDFRRRKSNTSGTTSVLSGSASASDRQALLQIMAAEQVQRDIQEDRWRRMEAKHAEMQEAERKKAEKVAEAKATAEKLKKSLGL